MTTLAPLATAAPSTRLRARTDLRAVFDAGAGGRSEAVAVRCRARGDDGPARWTVVAGRKVGKAVARNRAKRRLRAVLRALPLPAGSDLVVTALPAAVDVPFDELRAMVARSVARAARRAGQARR